MCGHLESPIEGLPVCPCTVTEEIQGTKSGNSVDAKDRILPASCFCQNRCWENMISCSSVCSNEFFNISMGDSGISTVNGQNNKSTALYW